MDPRYLPSEVILALRQVAMSGALTPEERAEINTWLAGGAQPRSSRVTQGINNVLRNHNMPTLTGEPQPSQAQGAAPTTEPPQAPSPNAALNTPAGPTPATPTLPVGTNTAPNAPPERAGNQTTPGLRAGFGVVPDGPGAGGTLPGMGGGPVFDGPGAGGSSPMYTPPAALATAVGDGPGAGGASPVPSAPVAPVAPPANPVIATPVAPGGGSAPVSPTGPVNGNAQSQEIILRDKPDRFLDTLLQKIGIDMSNPGLYGQDVASAINQYIPNMTALLGLGGMGGNVNSLYTDTIGNLANSFGQGKFFSGLQGMAGNARSGALDAAGRLVDPLKQQQIVQALLDLGSAGQNDYLRQGQIDDLARANLGFARTAQNTIGTSAYPSNYIDWAGKQQDPRYRAVLQLLGVGK